VPKASLREKLEIGEMKRIRRLADVYTKGIPYVEKLGTKLNALINSLPVRTRRQAQKDDNTNFKFPPGESTFGKTVNSYDFCNRSRTN